MTLSETFDIDPFEPEDTTKSIPSTDSDVDDDYIFVRDQLYDIVNKGKLALAQAVNVAIMSDDVEAFDAVSKLMKASGDNLDKVMKLHKERKEVKGTSEPKKQISSGKVVNNTLVVATTADLLKQLSASMISEDEE